MTTNDGADGMDCATRRPVAITGAGYRNLRFALRRLDPIIARRRSYAHPKTTRISHTLRTMSEESTKSDRSAADNACGDDAAVVAATRRWVERAVIGLNLCPFARAPFVQQRVRFRVSHARSEDALLADLREELEALHAADPLICETTLLIHPGVLADFLDYNDFLDAADATLLALGLEGELQVASFHPDYRFADAAEDAIENCTNRSPYPTLHLLREASIEHAVESVADTDDIYRRNVETLRRLGADGWRSLWRDAGEN